MNRQLSVQRREGLNEDFSFLEALEINSPTSSSRISEKELNFPVPPAPASNQPAPHKTAPKTSRAATNMASRAQVQSLELCHKTTALIDLISIHILEYLTTAKELPQGFETLAHDFLDSCQILFAIEAGLAECNRDGQKLPSQMTTELDNKFRVTQADFQILNHMLGKFLGSSTKLKRGWGKLFGDNESEIRRVSLALGKTRESLRMSSIVFQWTLGDERIEKEMGIGYTGLAAALDRMDDKKAGSKPKAVANSNTRRIENELPQLPQPQSPPLVVESNFFQQQPPRQQDPQAYAFHQTPPSPWPDRSASKIEQDRSYTVNSMLGPLSPAPAQYASPAGSGLTLHSGVTDVYTHSTAMSDDTRSLLSATESEHLLDDIKITRVQIDPSSMPHVQARVTAESDNENMRAALISAIRTKNHRLVEQWLHRGVSPNTGPNMHALREAIHAHDEESVRLLLLFGADPNEPDRENITPLFAAVQKSFLAGATTLLKYGAMPNLAAGPDLESPLAAAVIANRIGFSYLLLTYNGDPNQMTSNGNTLLISAIQKKTPKKFIDLILDYGADPNAKSREGKTALFEATQLARADIMTTLLEHKANPNLPGPKHILWPSTYHAPCLQVMLNHGADHKKCPGIMELAASLNNIESVRILLKAGVNPNTRKDGVYTPLCTAIRDDRPELLRLLLGNGADPNVMASEYPAFKCVTHDRMQFLPPLVAAGATLNSPKGILETAVSSNNMEALNWLLDQNVNPNDKSSMGGTPLTTAIRENRIEMVDLLLLRGADPNLRGEGWPLCMAVRNPQILKRILSVIVEPRAFKGVLEMAVHADQLESVKLLLASGVSVEDRNVGVFSPLTTAIREDHREIFHYLINGGGADVNSPGEHLPIVKALRHVHEHNGTEIIETLLDHGADPNKIYRGWNGFMQAVENSDVDVLRLLSKKAGVDLETKDEMGRTVVEMAASRGWDEGVKILKAGDIEK